MRQGAIGADYTAVKRWAGSGAEEGAAEGILTEPMVTQGGGVVKNLGSRPTAEPGCGGVKVSAIFDGI